jgi:hypothetical protein
VDAQQQQQQQQRLVAAGINHLVRSTPSLLQLLGSADDLSVQELLDGVINLVYAGGLEQHPNIIASNKQQMHADPACR